MFVSYSRANASEAQVLALQCEQLMHEVWIDEQIPGGQPWWDEILEKIRECDALVILLSRDSLASSACAAEWRYAELLRKPMLPVAMTSVSRLALPPNLSALQVVERVGASSQEVTARLKAAFAALPSAVPLPDPLPEPPPIPRSSKVARIWLALLVGAAALLFGAFVVVPTMAPLRVAPIEPEHAPEARPVAGAPVAPEPEPESGAGAGAKNEPVAGVGGRAQELAGDSAMPDPVVAPRPKPEPSCAEQSLPAAARKKLSDLQLSCRVYRSGGLVELFVRCGTRDEWPVAHWSENTGAKFVTDEVTQGLGETSRCEP